MVYNAAQPRKTLISISGQGSDGKKGRIGGKGGGEKEILAGFLVERIKKSLLASGPGFRQGCICLSLSLSLSFFGSEYMQKQSRLQYFRCPNALARFFVLPSFFSKVGADREGKGRGAKLLQGRLS